MSATLTRALATVTGHPILKLVLLTVAAAPGCPAAADVAGLAEIPVDLAQDALAELVRRGHLLRTGDVFAAPDALTYDRADTEPPEDLDPDRVAAALESGDIGGYAFGHHGPAAVQA